MSFDMRNRVHGLLYTRRFNSRMFSFNEIRHHTTRFCGQSEDTGLDQYIFGIGRPAALLHINVKDKEMAKELN